jgi:creatinine amidohydrolase
MMVDWTASSRAIHGAAPDVAVLATSSIEQHGAHLPLCTDHLIATALSRLVAERLDAYLLPALPVVSAWEHSHFKGTASLAGPTVLRVLHDVVRSLHEDGFRKVVLLNTHGGNWMVKPAAVELSRRFPELLLVYGGGDMLAYRGQRAVTGELHAGDGETSAVLACAPELVKPHAVDAVPEDTPASYLDYVGTAGVAPTGVWGRPTLADAGEGKRFLEERADRIAAYATETFAALESIRASAGLR